MNEGFRRARLFMLVACALTWGCDQTALTRDEAIGALDEMSLSVQAHEILWDVASLSAALPQDVQVEGALSDLNQLLGDPPSCLVVTLNDDGSGVVLSFQEVAEGVGCSWRGRTWIGEASMVPGGEEAPVALTLTDLVVGDFLLTGTGTIVGSGAPDAWSLTMDLDWSLGANLRTGQLVDKVTLSGQDGRRVYVGERSWQGAGGDWSLVTDGMGVALGEPVPEDGSASLITPANKTLTLSFSRSGERDVRVAVGGPGATFVFTVQIP